MGSLSPQSMKGFNNGGGPPTTEDDAWLEDSGRLN